MVLEKEPKIQKNGGEMRENLKMEKMAPFSPKLLVCSRFEEEDEVWGFFLTFWWRFCVEPPSERIGRLNLTNVKNHHKKGKKNKKNEEGNFNIFWRRFRSTALSGWPKLMMVKNHCQNKIKLWWQFYRNCHPIECNDDSQGKPS